MIVPLRHVYSGIVSARNRLYKNGFLKSYALGAPTFSVGNVTVGGTGKTPLVALLTEILAGKGEKVCILTRGYGRRNSGERVIVSDGENFVTDAKKSGDEPLELARKLFDKAVIIADKNRAEAGLWARKKFGITAFVLDDGFQHLKIRRDFDIVCIDAANPFGNRKMLPDGILREPLKNLSRADAIVITRANLSADIEVLKSEILKFSDCPIFVARNKFSALIEINDFNKRQNTNLDETKLRMKSALAFCALGNPDNFFNQLRDEGFNIQQTETFSDHHFYTQKDIESLEFEAEKQKINVLLSTAKDAVKLASINFTKPCYIIENKTFIENEEVFRQLIYDKLQK